MYLNSKIVKKAIEGLKNIHPFFGISFLAFKAKQLPIGESTHFPVSTYEKEMLELYYKPEESSWYFTPFKSSGAKKYWIKKDYPGKGAQKTRTTQFKDAFIHETDTHNWGWQANYVAILKQLIDRYQEGVKIPLRPLAIWLYRSDKWKQNTTLEDIVKKFTTDFYISDDELSELFEHETLLKERLPDSFQDDPVAWDFLKDVLNIPPAPDAPTEKGYYLSSMQFENISPFDHIEVEISPRLNIFTGDNGLGKTLLLEAAWWGLSGQWTSEYLPSFTTNSQYSSIKFGVTAGRKPEVFHIKYTPVYSNWYFDESKKLIEPGLVVYQRVDGLVGVFDSSRKQSQALVFDNQQLWDGYNVRQAGKSAHICNGLIQDWTFWQTSEEESFVVFKEILRILSPPGIDEGDLGVMEPGKPVRISGDSRLIPTIKHAYGEVPVTIASAAVKRVLSIAYLIYWSWKEHQEQSRLNHMKPHRQLIILIDEIEAHLHPKWQRLVLPAILSVVRLLSKSIGVQILVTTHSPLVMASVEPIFDPTVDSLFHFDLEHHKNVSEIILRRLDFSKRGSANEWLKSESFEMKQPASIEVEKAISDAIKLMEADTINPESVKSVHQRLINTLAPHDSFWIRWNYFAQRYITV